MEVCFNRIFRGYFVIPASPSSRRKFLRRRRPELIVLLAFRLVFEYAPVEMRSFTPHKNRNSREAAAAALSKVIKLTPYQSAVTKFMFQLN
jgi:hypothetical protein